ncbi:HPr(Ser) kinase/phosphatase [Paenibacillus chartarius]|uniref:HPr kinase/phosphorylase n=1 Tax=Paenibacillus chartarius TaxID=747481 RepID=A0ABV6DGF2_9BACL
MGDEAGTANQGAPNAGVSKSVSVRELVNRLKLEVIVGEEALDRPIRRSKVHRPGLEFAGYYDFFPIEHVQVLGKKEITYLHKLTHQERDERIGNVVKYHPPCFVVTWNQDGLEYLTAHCRKEGIPLLRTPQTTTEFMMLADGYLMKQLAPEIQVHGVCVTVAGTGILLRGRSGIGKSETALALIRRGHRLVADDAVVLKKVNPQVLLGTHNGTTREFLALRSVGLMNVVRVYGRGAFQDETRIVLDIELVPWKENELYNDLQLEPQTSEYMGVRVPCIQIPLQPGRDVAALIEAAAHNWYLQTQGYSAADEFMRRLQQQ